jgi:membrane-anchored protein YejM (alkaline phosphatase superfamily)
VIVAPGVQPKRNVRGAAGQHGFGDGNARKVSGQLSGRVTGPSTPYLPLSYFYRKRLRALQSLDDVVARLVNTLSTRKDTLTGKPLIDNTYIVFTSDNGMYLGEHRLTEKAAAYNAAPRVPLLIRGPSVPQGATRPQMALNNDLAPTFAELAGVASPAFVDGRSLMPLLSASPPLGGPPS